jgi:hypothetical protein
MSSSRPASHTCSGWSAHGMNNHPTCYASYCHPATCHTHSWCIRSFRTPDPPCCCPAASLAAVPPGHSQAQHPAPCCCCLWLPLLLLPTLAHSCPGKALPKAALHRHSGASPQPPPDLRTNSSRAQASKHARVHARKAHTHTQHTSKPRRRDNHRSKERRPLLPLKQQTQWQTACSSTPACMLHARHSLLGLIMLSCQLDAGHDG